MIPIVSSILNIGSTLIDRLIPDPKQKAEAKEALLKMQQDGEFKEMEVQMSAIVAEAKSNDKWTSRARPSFLYVIYIMILFSLPMGILYACEPIVAKNITMGVQAWLNGIPQGLWGLFGVGYLGYVGGRSYDKKQILSGKK